MGDGDPKPEGTYRTTDGWARKDRWESGEISIVLIADALDTSPIHPGWGSGYHPSCPHCRTGLVHSVALHQQLTEEGLTVEHS